MDTGALTQHLETILRELETRMSRPGIPPGQAPASGRQGGWGELLRYIAWANRQLKPAPDREEKGSQASPESTGSGSTAGGAPPVVRSPGIQGPGGPGFSSAEGRRRKGEELRLRAHHLTRRLPPHAYQGQGFQLMELVRLTGSAHEGMEIQESLHLLVRDLDGRHRRLRPVPPEAERLLTLLRELAILTWVQARAGETRG